MCLEDFSDHEAMSVLARDLKVDAICSSNNEFSIHTSAYFADSLSPGFDHFLTTLQLNNKDKFRQLVKKLDLQHIAWYRDPVLIASFHARLAFNQTQKN